MKNNFLAFKENQWVSGIPCFFGHLDFKSISADKAIFWLPTQDSVGPAEVYRDFITTDGELKAFETIAMREAGVDIYCFCKEDLELTELVNTVFNALYETAGNTYRNFWVSSLRYLPRDEERFNTVGYVLSVVIKIPIYRLFPAAEVQTIQITHTP